MRPSEASPREAILLLALAAFNSGISLRCVEPMLPQLAADFGTTVSAASFIITSFALAYAAAVLLQGPLGDRFGKLRVVTIGTALAGVTSLACAAAWDVSSLAAARFELARLAALVIRIEDEAAALDAFQEHHPGAGCTIGAHGGERHRVGQRQPRAQGIVEPALELPQRIALGSSFREAGAHVFLAQIGDVHTRILRCEIQRPREIAAFSL